MTQDDVAPDAPGAADRLVLAGLDAHRAGNLDAAATLYAQALAASPNHPDALNLSGAIAFARGRHDDAIRLIGKAIRAKPDHLDAHLNIAEAYEAAGRRRDAIAAGNASIAAAPDFADGHARLARLLASEGDAVRALAHARVALALDPDHVEALCGRALALIAMRRFVEANAAYARALELDPDDLRAITGSAVLLRDTDSPAEAQALYRRALAISPDDPGLMASLAALIEIDGDTEGARTLFEAALARDPASAEIRFSLGRCLRDIGLFDEAATAFEQALKHNPAYAPAALALVRMKRLVDTPLQRKSLARLASDNRLAPRNRVQAGFALAELADRAGEYDAAFARYAEANALYRRTREAAGERFDRAELLALITSIDAGLAADYAAVKDWGNATELPVFIVGLPRSGTTLVEQICASHSQVTGLGELRAIQHAARTIAGQNEGRARLAEWDAAGARAEADRHAASLAARSGGAVRVVDKNPHNLMRLGLISALFPKARVIWCRRDPRDVVVSNHTLFFGTGNVYSTDQADCAFAVREIDRLGSIWQRELKLEMIDVIYEDLVADLEPQVRRIIDFLGLPWENACLDFHRTERHVDTPSSWQVRQPVYSSSVGRWRRFEKHLGPMLTELAK